MNSIFSWLGKKLRILMARLTGARTETPLEGETVKDEPLYETDNNDQSKFDQSASLSSEPLFGEPISFLEPLQKRVIELLLSETGIMVVPGRIMQRARQMDAECATRQFFDEIGIVWRGGRVQEEDQERLRRAVTALNDLGARLQILGFSDLLLTEILRTRDLVQLTKKLTRAEMNFEAVEALVRICLSEPLLPFAAFAEFLEKDLSRLQQNWTNTRLVKGLVNDLEFWAKYTDIWRKTVEGITGVKDDLSRLLDKHPSLTESKEYGELADILSVSEILIENAVAVDTGDVESHIVKLLHLAHATYEIMEALEESVGETRGPTGSSQVTPEWRIEVEEQLGHLDLPPDAELLLSLEQSEVSRIKKETAIRYRQGAYGVSSSSDAHLERVKHTNAAAAYLSPLIRWRDGLRKEGIDVSLEVLFKFQRWYDHLKGDLFQLELEIEPENIDELTESQLEKAYRRKHKDPRVPDKNKLTSVYEELVKLSRTLAQSRSKGERANLYTLFGIMFGEPSAVHQN